nr:DUF2752 domain-containing protein [Tomitella biformata]
MHAARVGLVWTWAVAGSLVALGLGYLAVANPHDPGVLMPKCPTKLLTGLDCPGCGGLRMTHDLLHGDFVGAAHSNAFLLSMIPVVVVLLWIATKARWQGRPLRVAPKVGYSILVVAIVFTVVRNLPGWPLTPA